MSGILRLACFEDEAEIETLIHDSVRKLHSAHYSPAQIAAALGPVFGVDRQLISDGTYFVITQSGQILAAGGWSRRLAVFGGDRGRVGEDALLDPGHDPARIRAFFVHPASARQGLGRRLLQACESALTAAGFRRAELVATLAGEPFYASFDYQVIERYETPLASELTLPVVRMHKNFDPSSSRPF